MSNIDDFLFKQFFLKNRSTFFIKLGPEIAYRKLKRMTSVSCPLKCLILDQNRGYSLIQKCGDIFEKLLRMS